MKHFQPQSAYKPLELSDFPTVFYSVPIVTKFRGMANPGMENGLNPRKKHSFQILLNMKHQYLTAVHCPF